MKTEVDCSNNYRCWECKEDCFVKQLFMLDDIQFITVLHDSFPQNIGYMMAHGIPMKEAEKLQEIKNMTLITSRIKFLQSRY